MKATLTNLDTTTQPDGHVNITVYIVDLIALIHTLTILTGKTGLLSSVHLVLYISSIHLVIRFYTLFVLIFAQRRKKFFACTNFRATAI